MKFELKWTKFALWSSIKCLKNPNFLSLFLYFFSFLFSNLLTALLFTFYLFFKISFGPKALHWSSPQWRGRPNNSPPPLHMVGFSKPVLHLQASSFSLGKDFMNISDPFSLICTFSKCKSFNSSTSRIQWYLTFICLDLEWNVEFLERWIAL